MLKQVLSCGFIAGALVSLCFTALQEISLTPLIVEAEIYEQHIAQAETSIPRWVGSFAANTLISIAFCFIFLAAYLFFYRGPIKGKTAAILALSGYVSFYMIPALVIYPSLPGIESHIEVVPSQFLWLATVLCSITGLLILRSLGKKRWFGILVIMLPLLIFPKSELIYNHAALIELWPRFVWWSSMVNAGLWIAVAVFTSLLFNYFSHPEKYAY